MPLSDTLPDFAAAVPPMTPLMGLDPGTKTIGVAVCDPGRMIATPVETIRRAKFKADAARLQALIEERGVGGLILGLPLNMDGSEGPRVQSVRAFQRNLDKAFEEAGHAVPMVFWDERLSTQAVTRTLLEADTSRKRRGELVDKMAAAFILQGALDFLSRP